MFIERMLAKTIRDGAKQVPVIAITGPRQSGKSTLAKEIFNNHTYLDMQQTDLFELASSDPKGFLNIHKNDHGLIIDEAQYVPGLFPQIKVEADKNPQSGYFILSGSQNFLLHEKISESLAGRAYFYHLLPFSIEELKSVDLLELKIFDQMMKGFYPRVYQPSINIQEYYKNYINTYVERDIRSIKNIENLITFQKFMQLCALRIGNPLNVTDLAANCGISVATAKGWLSLLETSFILFFIPSYHTNLGKRVTKSPKLYFYDVGLAASLTNVSQEAIIFDRMLYGALFENMIIVDCIKNLKAQTFPYTASFFRDTNQNEIDLILEFQGRTIPIEIKASETMHPSFFKTADWFSKAVPRAHEPIVIYGGTAPQHRSQGTVLPWTHTADILKTS